METAAPMRRDSAGGPRSQQAPAGPHRCARARSRPGRLLSLVVGRLARSIDTRLGPMEISNKPCRVEEAVGIGLVDRWHHAE
jgi:hypothetical protein